MRIYFVINLLVACIFLSILAFLYQKTQTLDTENHNILVSTLHEMERIDNTRTENVLRSQLSLNEDYDKLAKILNNLNTVVSKWKEYDIQKIYEQISNNEANNKQKYLEKLQERTELIEKYKTNHAVLSNSARYFPTAIDELHHLLINTENKNIENNDVNDLLNISNTTLSNILRYIQEPSENLQEKIEDNINDIKKIDRNIKDENINSQLGFIYPHADVILRYKPVIDKVLENIVKITTTNEINALIANYNSLQDNQLLIKEKYQFALIGFSILLLLSLLVMAIRLRKSHHSLDNANKTLKISNETLEENVKERTKKLTNTLKKLKQSQTQLIQAEKMSSLGQMIAGIAHEINTPLGYIKSNVQLIEELFGSVSHLLSEQDMLMKLMLSDSYDEAELKKQMTIVAELNETAQENETMQAANELLNDSLSGLDDIAELVLNLKNFSRLDLAKVSKTDIHQCLDSTLMIAKNALKYKVTIKKEFGELPKITCSPSQVNQVFLNILNNAVQAIEDKGTILIKTEAADKFIRIIIQDNGKGIPKDILPQIFNPFFTTKLKTPKN
jgi:signal transduction histidine kinase